jgi:hypothetical protein
MAQFRKVGPAGHLDEIKSWWEAKLDELVALSKR